ncbi:Protein of unknown function [Bacillus thuringiensis]|nr:Protein of unknown function [Bacillus thuringiensis]
MDELSEITDEELPF